MRTTTRRRRLAAVLVAAAATATVSLASPVAAYADDESDPSTSNTSTSATSQEQYQTLDDVAQQYHPLGVYTADDGSLTMLALPADTPPADEDQLESKFPPGMNILGYISQFTTDEEKQLEQQVAARGWIADKTVDYSVGVSYDAEDDVVLVDTDAPESDTQSLVNAHPDKIEVRQTRFETQRNRFDDTPFYRGGMAITNTSSNGGCTAGAAIKNVFTGVRSMLTAGHCGKLGDNFVNRHTNGSWGSFVGTVRSVHTTMDVAELRGSDYGGWIWTGGTTASTSRKAVAGGLSPFVGQQVCVSGSVSLNHCGHPVSNSSYTYATRSPYGTYVGGGTGFTYDQGGTVTATGFSPGRLTQPGDSGAPIYTLNREGEAIIAGIHSALIYQPPTDNNNKNRKGCGCWKMLGVKIGSILSSNQGDLVKFSDD